MGGGKAELVIVEQVDDEYHLMLGTVEDLATAVGAHTRVGEGRVFEVRAVAPSGGLVEVMWRIEGAHKYDDNDWAHPKVLVTMPDGTTRSASYRVDGRS